MNYIFILVVFLIILILAVIFKNKEVKGKKLDSKILDRKTIITDSKILPSIFLIPFLLIFILVILYVLVLFIYKKDIIGLGITLAICIPILLAVKSSIKTNMRTLFSDYVIVVDELKDKYCSKEFDSDNINVLYWQLYFKQYFKKYDRYVYTNYTRGDKYNIGEEFYLVFFKGSVSPYVFPVNDYTLPESEKKHLKTLEDAKSFLNLEEFVLKQNDEKIIINKKKLKKEFKEHIMTAIIISSLAIISIGFIYFISQIPDCNLAVIIIVSFISLFLILLSIVKISYVYSILKNIKNGNIKIKKDTIKSLNNGIDFMDSNRMMSLKFENYKNLVYVDKKNFLNTKVGDEFYLVFVKGEKNPLGVYSLNRSTIDNDLLTKYKTNG